MTEAKLNDEARYITLRGDPVSPGKTPAARPFWKALHHQPDLQILGLAVLYNVASKADSLEQMLGTAINGFLGVLGGHAIVRVYEEIKLQQIFKKSSQELSLTVIDKNPDAHELNTLANLNASQSARYSSLLAFGVVVSAVTAADAISRGDHLLVQYSRDIMGLNDYYRQLPVQVYAVFSALLRTPAEFARHNRIANGDWVIKSDLPERDREDPGVHLA